MEAVNLTLHEEFFRGPQHINLLKLSVWVLMSLSVGEGITGQETIQSGAEIANSSSI